MTLAAFAMIWFVHLLAAISPGPAVLMAARTGLSEGASRGAALAIGLALGACFWAAAAIFGLQLIFEWMPGLMVALRIAGAAYLFWLAIKMWRSADEPLNLAEGQAARGGAVALIWRGIATQLTNPKPAVFFGAVFASLVPPHAPAFAWIALLVAVFANEFLWNAFVARIFSAEAVKRRYLRLKAPVDRVFGALLIALGIRLVVN